MSRSPAELSIAPPDPGASGRSAPVNPRGDSMPSQPAPVPPDDPSRNPNRRAARSGQEPAAHRTRRRHVHDPRRRIEDTAGQVHAHRHARAARRRAATAPARLRGDVHRPRRRGRGDLPRRDDSLPAPGETINVPANAPHAFTNSGPIRQHGCCVCARPPGRRSSSPTSASPSPPGPRRPRRWTPTRSGLHREIEALAPLNTRPNCSRRPARNRRTNAEMTFSLDPSGCGARCGV